MGKFFCYIKRQRSASKLLSLCNLSKNSKSNMLSTQSNFRIFKNTLKSRSQSAETLINEYDYPVHKSTLLENSGHRNNFKYTSLDLTSSYTYSEMLLNGKRRQ